MGTFLPRHVNACLLLVVIYRSVARLIAGHQRQHRLCAKPARGPQQNVRAPPQPDGGLAAGRHNAATPELGMGFFYAGQSHIQLGQFGMGLMRGHFSI
ncbi:hypothetical protein [Rivihabitans pingtungensis]|uniref:hypothetical protein n=1 Tax=Rivihabitans pingtungensis TaxID=1054498 RepID=UPI002FD88D3C